MPSATTADSSDSMPPSSAMAMAAGNEIDDFCEQRYVRQAGRGQGARDAAELRADGLDRAAATSRT